MPYRRKGDIDYGPTPTYNQGSLEMEKTMEQQADRLVGLDEASPISQIRKQFLVDKFLSHCAEVVSQCYRCFQRFGPDQIFLGLQVYLTHKCSIRVTLMRTSMLQLVTMFLTLTQKTRK